MQLTLKQFDPGHLLAAHLHRHSKLNWVVRGRLIEWTEQPQGSLTAVYRSAPALWAVKAGTTHRLQILSGTTLLSCPWIFGIHRCNVDRTDPARAAAALMLLLLITGVKACEIEPDAIKRLLQSEEQVVLPECFFKSLAAAAAGGDPQAQLDLGILRYEGLDPTNRESPNNGLYWIHRSIDNGHPTAKHVLERYREALSC